MTGPLGIPPSPYSNRRHFRGLEWESDDNLFLLMSYIVAIKLFSKITLQSAQDKRLAASPTGIHSYSQRHGERRLTENVREGTCVDFVSHDFFATLFSRRKQP